MVITNMDGIEAKGTAGQSSQLSFKNGAMAFALCLIVTFWSVFKDTPPPTPIHDEVAYISIAQNISKTGVFSNPGNVDSQIPGAFFSPIYPAFLSLFSQASSTINDSFECYRSGANDCNLHALTPIFAVQALFAAVSAFCVFLIGIALFNRLEVALISMGITLIAGSLSKYADLLLTENIAFLFFMLSLCFYAFAIKRPENIKSWALAAGFLSLGILTRPTYIYFLYLLVPLAFLWSLINAHLNVKKSALNAFSVAVVSLFILIPWATRNYLQFDGFFLTDGYASFILVQRLAYNMMSWGEWAVSFIYFLPDFGDSLARVLFAEDLYVNLELSNNSNTYYQIGNTTFRSETLELAGSHEKHLAYLINNVLLPDIGKHIMVTFALAVRGAWAGKYIGLLALILLPYVLVLLKERKQMAAFFLFILPCFFFLGFHAFVSVSVIRYNEPMIAVYALILAIAFSQLGLKIISRMKKLKR